MLVNLKTLIEDAEKNNYAVGMFTTPNITTAEAVISAAEELNAPVMIGQAQLYDDFGPMEKYGPIYADMARKAKVPVCLHLDHGTSIEYIMKAVRCGYTSVMADFSELPFEENAKMVRLCADICHSIDVSVEGLCGKMPSVEMIRKDQNICLKEYFTDPEELKEFVRITGADAMTVSFGTVHGMKVTEPVLDMGHLDKLKSASSCALVMHGSSGVEINQLKEAISRGLRKINVYTKIAISPQKAIEEEIKKQEEPMWFHEILNLSKRTMKEAAMESIKLFSNGHSFK